MFINIIKSKYIMIKPIIFLLMLVLMVNNAFSFFCFLDAAPEVNINDPIVYDENKVFKNFLSSTGNVIEEGDYIRINFVPTTDENNNIVFENFAVMNDYKPVLVSYRNVSNFDNLVSSGSVVDFLSYEYLDEFYYADVFFSPIVPTYNPLIPQYDAEFVIKFEDSGFFTLVYEAEDESAGNCEDNIVNKALNITVLPKPNPTNFTCNGVLNLPSVNGNIDILLNSGCTDITVSHTTINLSLFIQTGTFNPELETLSFTLNDGNGGYNSLYRLNFFDNYNNMNIETTERIQFKGNFYDFEQLYVIGDRLNFSNLNENSVVNIIPITQQETILVNTFGDFNGGGLIFPFEFIDGTIETNRSSGVIAQLTDMTEANIIFSRPINRPYNTGQYTILRYYNTDMYNNQFYNMSKIIFESNFPNYNKVYLNTFQFNSVFEAEPIFTSLANPANNTLSKNINGVMVGNIWLDSSGEDIFICPSDLNIINYEGVVYSVCSSPVTLFCDSGKCVYDYIIVTDEAEGGFEPIPENEKPIAIININPTETEINTNMNWDISSSYDNDGTIENTKVWVDNILFENVESSTITSSEPKIVNFIVEVTDNEGLKTTLYRNGIFTDIASVCLSSPIPYAEIQITDLGDNQFEFEAINEFNGGESTEDLQYYWTINQQQVIGKNIISSVDFNQSVSLFVFNGCNDYIDWTIVNSTSVYNPFTEPVLDLVCDLSSSISPSVINCSLDYDLRGYNLTNIIWNLNNIQQSLFTGLDNYEKIINDNDVNVISVTVYSDAPNQKTAYYTFALVDEVINESYIPPTNDTNGTETPQITGQDIIDFGSISNTNENTIGFLGNIIAFIVSIAVPLITLIVIIMLFLGIINIIR